MLLAACALRVWHFLILRQELDRPGVVAGWLAALFIVWAAALRPSRSTLVAGLSFLVLVFAFHWGYERAASDGREYFVTREEAIAVLQACPDAQWKLLFALSRYGGLRCPSEHLGLRWGDVDWQRERMVVRSPKTARHDGKGERVMPLWPELQPYLQSALDELLENFDPKTDRLSEQPVITRYRDTNANLRTQLLRIIHKAKLKPWPKLFQNLYLRGNTVFLLHYC